MPFCNNALNISLRLTAVMLATVLAGCSLNPFSRGDDSAAQNVPISSTTQPRRQEPAPVSDAEPYQPVVERVSGPVPLASGHPNEYVVQVGDTLWDISAKFLRDPWYWPEIWYVNPDIENPHLIYPGDVLGLIYIDGQPRITNVRAGTYRMSPQARVTPLSESINSIPFDAVAAFLSSGVILQKEQADALPYLLDTRGDHLIASAGNSVYVRGGGISSDPEGTQYNVVHVGDPLIDPDDDRLVGYHGILIGEGVMRRSGDPATIALTDSRQEAIIGDRFLPASVDSPLNFFPRSPSSVVEGRIIAVVGGVTQIGQYQVVVLNRGSNNGLTVGDVLSIFQTGETIKDRYAGGEVKLPDENAGTLMIFKTYDRISYGLVMEATDAIHIHDTVRNPR